uniref:NAC domain-containing protein n=1 Tax=Leersia perrieri TaxID=77586 RepID=A0A0D9V433_9ORYZ
MSPSRADEADSGADLGSHPTDHELLTRYLRRHVESGKNPWAYVHDADVYAADPEDLTGEYPPAVASDGSKAWYFFTTVRAKTGGGQRRARAVGDGGCWHSESGARDVVAGARGPGSVAIGRRQFFSFVKKEGSRRVRSGWIMVEIGLNLGQQDVPSDELVLCKVYRSPRAPPPAVNRSTAAPPPAAAAEKSKTEEAAAPPPVDVKPVVADAAAPIPDTKIVKAAKEAAAAATGCKRKADGKSSGARRGKRLCARCQAETSESDSEAETAVLDNSPRSGDETADSSDVHVNREAKLLKFL